QPVIQPAADIGKLDNVADKKWNQRQREVAMSDRRAELFGGALDIHVDPLMIARRVGETIDALLVNVQPVGGAEIGSNQAGNIGERDFSHALLLSSFRLGAETRLVEAWRAPLWSRPMDLDALTLEARAARAGSYAPYSKINVGAAVLTADG